MPDRISLLALDLASRVGFAWWDGEEDLLASGAFRAAPKGLGTRLFLEQWSATLGEVLANARPTHIVFETPWVGPKTHQETARKLLGLASELERVCYARHIPEANIYEVNVSAVRKHFTGRGRAKGGRKETKEMVLRECWRRGMRAKDDDEADALAILDYAAALLDIAVVPQTHITGLRFLQRPPLRETA